MPTYEPTPTRGGGPEPIVGKIGTDQPSTPSAATKSKGKAKGPTIGQKNQETMPQEIAQALSPYESVANALPAEYQQAMAGYNQQISSDPSTGNASLDSAIHAAGSAAMAGEAGMSKALAGIGTAGATLAKDLPYTDVLSTLLTEKKNQLQYGTVPTYTVDTSHWSAPLQDIYKYIEGKGSGSTVPAGAASTGGGPSLPSITAAAAGTQGSSTVPGAGGPGLGQGG